MGKPTITGVSTSGRARLLDAAKAAGPDDRGVRAEAVDRAILHAHGNATQALAVLAHDQIHGKLLHKE